MLSHVQGIAARAAHVTDFVHQRLDQKEPATALDGRGGGLDVRRELETISVILDAEFDAPRAQGGGDGDRAVQLLTRGVMDGIVGRFDEHQFAGKKCRLLDTTARQKSGSGTRRSTRGDQRRRKRTPKAWAVLHHGIDSRLQLREGKLRQDCVYDGSRLA